MAADQVVLVLDVTVRRQALKNALQRLGASYAADKPRPYVLTQKGLGASDLDILRRMQIVSGLQTTLDSGPALHVERLASGCFSASLSMTGRNWNETSPTLEGVWALIWGDYFGSAPVRNSLTENVVLELSGQGDPASVREVELALARMDKLADGVRLVSLRLAPEGFKARLTFRVVSRELLVQEISGLLNNKKMLFSIADN